MDRKIVPILGLAFAAFIIIAVFAMGLNFVSMAVYQYPTQLTEPGSIPWWSGSCWDESHECKQLDGKVPFTNTIIVDTDWKITNSIADHYINDNGEFTFGCSQTVNVYYQDELLGSVVRPDTAGFIVDMTKGIVYDDYNDEFFADAKDYMRITKGKSCWRPTYMQCWYYRNEITWVQRECMIDSDCDDDNPFTLHDKCEDNICISSDPVECVNNIDCEYFEECKDNICITASGWLDDDEDGIINKDDVCPDLYGTGSDGCPTLTEKIQNYINQIIELIENIFRGVWK